jgi:magnesium transporter
MISVDVCHGKTTESNLSLDQISPILNGGNGKQERKRVLWVDIDTPTDDDYRMLEEKFGFHPLALEDARNRNQRAKVDPYDGYLFLSIRAWSGETAATNDLTDATQEIDIFLGPNYIVTIHDASCAPLQETRRRWEQHPERMPEAQGNPAYLLYVLLDAVVDAYFPAVDAMDEAIDRVEMAIYAPEENGGRQPDEIDLKPALRMKKHLLLLRQTIAPMRDVLNELLRTNDPRLIPPSLRIYLQDVYDHTLRLVEQVDLHRDILSGVMDAIMAQTSNRLNQTMKKMTGWSIILMTDALIAGVYGMNFKNMPELLYPNGYYGALAGMAVLTTFFILLFRRIRWF